MIWQSLPCPGRGKVQVIEEFPTALMTLKQAHLYSRVSARYSLQHTTHHPAHPVHYQPWRLWQCQGLALPLFVLRCYNTAQGTAGKSVLEDPTTMPCSANTTHNTMLSSGVRKKGILAGQSRHDAGEPGGVCCMLYAVCCSGEAGELGGVCCMLGPGEAAEFAVCCMLLSICLARAAS